MKILNEGYDRHLRITIIVLVALPILLGVSNFATEIYYEKIVSFSLVYFNDAYWGFWVLYSFQVVVFIIMLIFYPIYPHIFSIERHLGKRNPRNFIAEYEFLKNTIYILLPFFLFALAFIILARVMQENPLNVIIISLGDPTLVSLFLTIMGVIFFIVGAALLRIILLNRHKRFKFYLAMVFFRSIGTVTDDVDKIKYLINGLSSYNKYIRRNLELEINNPKTIYSKIVSDPAINKIHLIEHLSSAFEDPDRLKPIRCLSEHLRIQDTEHFLIKESIGNKLQNWAGILGTLASTIAAVIGAVTTLKIPGLS